MKKVFAGLIFALGVLVAKANISSGLCYHLTFDNSLKPEFAEGTYAQEYPDNLIFKPGKVGSALELSQNKALSLGNYLGNLNPARGTVAFWFNPKQAPREQVNTIQLWRCGGLSLTMTHRNKKIYFMSASNQAPDGWVWDYSTHSHLPYTLWKADNWYHIAISWDATTKNKRLYIDGKQISEKNTQHIKNYNGSDTEILLGGNNSNGLFDELAIWQRQLADNEIAFLYNNAEESAQLLQQKQMPSPETSPLRVNLRPHPNPKELIFLPAATWTGEFELENISAQTCQYPARLILQDIWDKEWQSHELLIHLEPRQKKWYAFSFQLPKQRGPYRIGLYFEDIIKDVAVAAIWPEPASPPSHESFFGNHVSGWNPVFLELAARLGLGWQRVHDMLQFTWWNRVQSEPGVFTWKLDHIWERTRKHRMPVLGCLIGTPYWATKDGSQDNKGGARGFGLAPQVPLWRTYVRETVRHHKDDIRYWEIYNEPAVPGFWRGTPEELAILTNAACEEIRAEDPQAQIMSAGFTNNSWRYHRACAEAGLFKQLDIVSIHVCPGIEEPETESQKTEAIVNHFKQLWEEYGRKDSPCRIWSTESAIGSTSWFRGLDAPEILPEHLRIDNNAYQACKRIIQGVVIMQNLGIEKHFYYWFGPLHLGKRSYLNTSMIDVTNAPRPKQLARMAMAEHIDGKYFVKLIRKPEGRFWGAVYQDKTQAEHSALVWWCGNNGKLKINLEWPASYQIYDIMGNLISQEQANIIRDEPNFLQVKASAQKLMNALESASFTVLTPPDALPEQLLEENPAIPKQPDYVAPAENPSGTFFVDLRTVCNMAFADKHPGDGKGGWGDEGPMNDMRDMPTGKQTWYGVTFDIINPALNHGKSIITLRGQMVTPTLPETITIPMQHRSVRCLYFLHSASNGKRGVIGEYVIRYQSGQAVRIENRIPGNNGNWWNGYYYDHGEEAKVVPILVNSTLSGKPEFRYLRLFEWINPHPDDTIISIEACSHNQPASPIILAISGVYNQ